jgi:hypothetical protein
VAKSNIPRVVRWMVGTLLSFSTMAVSIRELSRAGFNIFGILAIRSGGSLVPCTTPRNMPGHSA